MGSSSFTPIGGDSHLQFSKGGLTVLWDPRLPTSFLMETREKEYLLASWRPRQQLYSIHQTHDPKESVTFSVILYNFFGKIVSSISAGFRLSIERCLPSSSRVHMSSVKVGWERLKTLLAGIFPLMILIERHNLKIDTTWKIVFPAKGGIQKARFLSGRR